MLFQRGHKHSEEVKLKISLAHTGKKTGKCWNKGIKTPEHVRRKMSIAHKLRVRNGKHPFWKGGITPLNETIRKSAEYKLWRESVFKRDNYTCVWCGAKNGNGKSVILNADHIKAFAFYPKLRFVIDNGRTLCKPCHTTTNNYGRPNRACLNGHKPNNRET